ncbi:uncharacterized protein [Branchiostoma lanceolatum]|uniref:uncharacterized protein n=1 Tax=Branchiostoma lanceolatum TaxID=7740 RepID=UPI003453D39B
MVLLVLYLWIVTQVYVVTTQMQDGEKIPYRCFGQAGSFGWSGDCACSSMLPWAMDNSIPQTNQQLVDQMQNIKARLDQLEAVTAQITSSESLKTGPAATDSRVNSRVDSRVDSTATTASAVQTTAGAATSSTVGSDVAISDGPQPSVIYTATPTQAVAALPIPRYYWDLSGKCNPQGSSQKQCNKSCRSKMVYANTGNRTGVTSGSLYLVANARSEARSTSNLPPCAIRTDRKRKDFIDFGSFRGTCPAQPELCQDGLSLAVWMKMKRKDNTYGDGQNPDLYFISTGGQTRSSRGFAVSAEWISMPSVAYRFALCTTVRDFDGVWFQCTHDVPDGTWFHFVFTWNKQTMLKVYIGGNLSGQTRGLLSGGSGKLWYSNLTLGRPNNLQNSHHASSAYSNLKIFERELSAVEVSALYNSER